MPICCEINFPLLPTLSDEERQCRTFVDPVAVHVARQPDQVAGVLDALVNASVRGNWCVGFVTHEAAPAFDAALQTKPAEGFPLAWFAEFTEAADGVLPAVPEAAQPAFVVSPWRTDTSPERFAECVESIRADIREGRFYQVNYTTRLNADFGGDALTFYRALQVAQPRGYHAFIDAGEFQLLSVSPELFFCLRDGVVTTQPMKGTAPRGDTAEADAALADGLTHSTKERAENLMIVDLLRNDLSRVATPSSVEVPHLFSLHPLPSVWQMTSTVRARLRARLTVKDVFAALFPCGSVTGAPKVEAMRAIVALESSARGAYCGAIGLVTPDGSACFNVGIRSVWIEHGRASFGVGSGITYDSTVAGEAAELAYKARFVQRASKRDDRVIWAERVDADMMARSPVLVWRNVTRIRLIQAFRGAYGAPADALLPGEPLICDGIELPLKHRKKRIDLEARGLIKGAQVIYLGPGQREGFARLHVVGAEDPQVSAAAIIKIEKPDEEEPFIPSAARMGAAFLHGSAVTIHKAQGSQWPDVQVFAPDLYAAAQAGRSEAGLPLWKRLAYVAITRAEKRLFWVVRNRLALPRVPLGVEDLRAAPVPLALEAEAG